MSERGELSLIWPENSKRRFPVTRPFSFELQHSSSIGISRYAYDNAVINKVLTITFFDNLVVFNAFLNKK